MSKNDRDNNKVLEKIAAQLHGYYKQDLIAMNCPTLWNIYAVLRDSGILFVRADGKIEFTEV